MEESRENSRPEVDLRGPLSPPFHRAPGTTCLDHSAPGMPRDLRTPGFPVVTAISADFTHRFTVTCHGVQSLRVPPGSVMWQAVMLHALLRNGAATDSTATSGSRGVSCGQH